MDYQNIGITYTKNNKNYLLLFDRTIKIDYEYLPNNIVDICSNDIVIQNIKYICCIIDIQSNIIYKEKNKVLKNAITLSKKIRQKIKVPVNIHKYKKNIYAVIEIDQINKKCIIYNIIGDGQNINLLLYNECCCNWSKKKKFNINNIDRNKYIDRTDTFIFSIDPDNCSDIDDAFHITEYPEYYELGIHIVDVSEYILFQSELDIEISKRAKSLYFKDKNFYMIPEYITNEMSFLDGKERYALSIIFYLDKNNYFIIKYKIEQSLIINNSYSYENIFRDCKDKSKINLLYEIGEQIYNRMNIPKYEKYNINKMVECLMLMSNNKIAEYLTDNSKRSIFRIQETLNDNVIEEIKSEHKYVDNILLKKTLYLLFSRAEYSIYRGDHYNLNMEAYTHFTSPLRRYIDIIIHRLIKLNMKNFCDNKFRELYINDRGLDNYLFINAHYNNEIIKQYNKIEKKYNIINKIFELYGVGDNIIIENGIIIGIDDINMYIYCKKIDDIVGCKIISRQTKNHTIYEATKLYFQSENINLYLFQEIEIQITIVLMSKKIIYVQIVNENIASDYFMEQ